MTTPNLCEKALLVKLTSHKPTLFKRQDAQTEQLQQLADDKAAAAYVKLFKFRTPVHEALSLHRDVVRLHHRMTLPMAHPKVAPRHSHPLLIRHGSQHSGQFFVHGAHERDATHAVFCSRNSRRSTLPTGVLGSSVRNSTTRGIL